VQEAGGRVTNLRNGAYSSRGQSILATNGHLHGAMVDVIEAFLRRG
jgi:fructose-1,6-bisphosphatase/inositol monophosphatase family enzyme